MVTSLILVSSVHSNWNRTSFKSFSNRFRSRSELLFAPTLRPAGEGIFGVDLLYLPFALPPPAASIGYLNFLPLFLRRSASWTREPTMFSLRLVSMIWRVPCEIWGRKDSCSRAVYGLLGLSALSDPDPSICWLLKSYLCFGCA